MARKPLADISNQQEVSLPSAPIAGKKQSIDVSSQKNGSIDILEVFKVVVREFDQSAIALGSTRSYKNVQDLSKLAKEILIELLATASVSKLNGHFDQVFKYAEHLCPQEVWIVHFSREDFVVIKPYWPSQKLQDK
ncbi:10595_t:CDS:2, partial [Racocetra fulgida]